MSVPLLDQFVAGYTLYVYAAFGADPTTDPTTWTFTDITADVLQPANIVITRGRFDELSQTSPSSCVLTLINGSGDYTPDRAESPYWPYVDVGLPIKVVVRYSATDYERFSGFADEFIPSWDETGNYAVVQVTAHGVLGRLGQTTASLRSALYRAISTSSPLAYWPLEGGVSSTSAASAVSGQPALAITSGSVAFASAGPDGSQPLPDFSAGNGAMNALVSGGSGTTWRVGFACQFTSAPFAFTVLAQWTTSGGAATVYVVANQFVASPEALTVYYTDRTGASPSYPTSSATDLRDGNWHWVTVDGVQSGSNISITAMIDGVTVLSTTFTSVTNGHITSIAANPPGQSSGPVQGFGHLAVWQSTPSADLVSAMNAYVGEDAVTRLIRLCGEENIPIGYSRATCGRLMGPQTVNALLPLLRECEDVDGGVLEDGVGFGLYLHSLTDRYNQVVAMSPALQQVKPLFQPVKNNLKIRNDVTVSRPNGSSARYIQPAGQPYAPTGAGGVGTVDEPETLNVQDDTTLTQRAQLLVHLGTTTAARYPSLSFDFAARTALLSSWIGCGLGARVAVSGRYGTGSADTPDVMLEGWSETVSRLVWQVAANCSPAQPWRVAVVEDATNPWRVDSDASTLTADITSSVLSIAVTSTDLWTTNAADLPFDINVGGEKATVTAVSAASNPTLTVTRSVNGVVKAHSAGAAVTLWQPPVIAL